eukprot:m.60741 g.60741  ORF g.60741 m.60741 type:complete len:205 (+) comp13129_c0_seq2:229-843(+)
MDFYTPGSLKGRTLDEAHSDEPIGKRHNLLDRATWLDFTFDTTWMCCNPVTMFEFDQEDRRAIKKTAEGTMHIIRAKEPLPENECVAFSMRVDFYGSNDLDIGVCGLNPTLSWLRGSAQSWGIGVGSPGGFAGVRPGLLQTGSIVTVAVDTGARIVEIYLDHAGDGNNELVRVGDIDFSPVYPSMAARSIKTAVEAVQMQLPPK